MMKKIISIMLSLSMVAMLPGCNEKLAKQVKKPSQSVNKISYKAQISHTKDDASIDPPPQEVAPPPAIKPAAKSSPRVNKRNSSNTTGDINNGQVSSFDQLLRNVEMGLPVNSSDPRIMETYNRAKEIVATVVKPGMTEFQKEKAIHDYLLTIIEPGGGSIYIYTAYGGLINGIANCSGYEQSMKLVLNMAGIEAKEISGNFAGSGSGHAWNLVKIDGKWYHVDLSADDGIKVNYNMFNQTDEQMKSYRYSWLENAFPPANTPFVWPK